MIGVLIVLVIIFSKFMPHLSIGGGNQIIGNAVQSTIK